MEESNIVNKFSIKLKIALGFGILITLFVLEFLFSAMSLNRIDERVNGLSNYSEITAKILQVNKDISEVQRLVLVYGRTGSNSVFLKLEKLFGTMVLEIGDLQDELSGDEFDKDLLSLVSVADRYGSNLKNLKTLHDEKVKQTNLLPILIFEKGLQLISRKLKAKNSRVHAQGLWYGINFHFSQFLINKNYKSRKEIKNKLTLLKNLLIDLKAFDKEMAETLSELQTIFNKGIVSSRNYSTLVNVIMSGDATEFTILAKRLEETILIKLEEKKQSSEEEIAYSQNQIIITLIAFIPVIILMIYFYNMNISNALIRISDTFEKYLRNDFKDEVPGLDREDEIGTLAKAANNFKFLSFQFQVEKDKAEKLAQTKSDFLANMSHEIRTPMNGVLGMISHLRDTSLTKEQKEMLDTVSSCGDSLSMILNDILDLSKVESGKLDLEMRAINLEKLLEELRFLFRPHAAEKGLSFQCEFISEDKPEFVKGDVTRMKQILINLLSNAIKFTDKGEVSLSVETKFQNKSVAILEFTIRDTGIGIPSESMESIFNQFSQSDSSTTRRFGGTGLGLSISQKLANLMGSSIFLESKPGEGSAFSIKLELELPTQKEIDSLSIDLEKDNDLQFGGHCLVVEDNNINIKVLTKRLDKLGISYDVAVNGQEALDLADSNLHDCVLMDLQMPVLDGLSAARELRKRGFDKPIIAMTANVQQSDQDACFDAGMDAFVAKPIKKDELIAALNKNLIKRSA